MAGELGGDLRFKSESVFLNFNFLDDLSTKGLKTGFHIGEVQIRAHIGEEAVSYLAQKESTRCPEPAENLEPYTTSARCSIGGWKIAQ